MMAIAVVAAAAATLGLVPLPAIPTPTNFWLLSSAPTLQSLSTKQDASAPSDVEQCRRIQQAHTSGNQAELIAGIRACAERPIAVELDAEAPDRRSFCLPGGHAGPIDLGELSFSEAGLGHSVWDAGVALSIWLQCNPEFVAGRRVLELGSGTGLGGISAGLAGAAAVTLTDLDTEHNVRLLANLEDNARINLAGCEETTTFSAEALDWADCTDASFAPRDEYERLIGSDLCYYEHTAPMLADAIVKNLAPSGRAAIVNVKGRKGLDLFLERLRASDQGEVEVEELSLVNNYAKAELLLVSFCKHAAAAADDDDDATSAAAAAAAAASAAAKPGGGAMRCAKATRGSWSRRSSTIKCALERETWMESDSATVFGRSRSPASDAGLADEDDYALSLDLSVISRAIDTIKRRSDQLLTLSSSSSSGSGSGAKEGDEDDDDDALASLDDEEAAETLVAKAVRYQSARNGAAAEAAYLQALTRRRSSGSAWYGLATLLHEHQHGGLPGDDGEGVEGGAGEYDEGMREDRLRAAVDAALIAARYEPKEPRALALLGDALNDLEEHREACRAWRAAEARGEAVWKALAKPWLEQQQQQQQQHDDGATNLSPFGPREPLRSLRVGDPPAELARKSNGRAFTARRLAESPGVFLLSGFTDEAERDAIVKAAIAAPMREVPRAEEGDEADERKGCEVAWLASPITQPRTAWADLMRDAAELVLPVEGEAGPVEEEEERAVEEGEEGAVEEGEDETEPTAPSCQHPAGQGTTKRPRLPAAGPAEDLHVVKYAQKGAYGLHLDATYAVPRAVTVLHYLNDVPPSRDGRPGYGGETWLPLAVEAGSGSEEGDPSGGGGATLGTPGEDGVLVSPRAGDALVFFSFTNDGEVERRSLHGGRPASETKWVANQWVRLALDDDAPVAVPKGPGFGPRVVT